MRFKLTCPHCAKALSALQKLLGQQIDCPHCKRRFTISLQSAKTDARPETAPRHAAPTVAPQQFSSSLQKSDSTKIEPGRRQFDAAPPVGNATDPCSAPPLLPPPQPPAANPSKTPI